MIKHTISLRFFFIVCVASLPEAFADSTQVDSTAGSVQHVNATQAAQILQERPEIKILDVRTPWEYNNGHIDGAVLVNYFSLGFSDKLAQLDTEATWLVHCKSGGRSGKTLALMQEAGFKSIIHLDGGMNAWRAAKLPVKTND